MIEDVIREAVIDAIQRGGTDNTDARKEFQAAVEAYFTHGTVAYHDAEVLKAAHQRYKASKK